MKAIWLSTQTIAEEFDIRDGEGRYSPRLALQLIDHAKVPTRKLGGCVRVRREDVEAAMTVRTYPGEGKRRSA